MTKQEFLLMQEQDLVTHQNKENLTAVLEVMKAVLQNADNNIDISSDKTCEECFKGMQEYARKNQKNGCFYFTPENSVKFVAEYLGVGGATQSGGANNNNGNSSSIVDLDNFF